MTKEEFKADIEQYVHQVESVRATMELLQVAKENGLTDEKQENLVLDLCIEMLYNITEILRTVDSNEIQNELNRMIDKLNSVKSNG